METKIAEIERLTGQRVFTGSIAGVRDTECRWAYVDLPEYRLQIPAKTDEEAVDMLLADVREWAK